LAAVALLAAGLAAWLVFADFVTALVYGGCCVVVVAGLLHRAGWLGRGQRIIEATWHADGHWTLWREGQPPIDAVLLGGSRVAPNCVWLHWRTEDRPWQRLRSMLLTSPDLPRGELRRLVVRLRLQGRSHGVLPVPAAD
jgi:hypothetical protein